MSLGALLFVGLATIANPKNYTIDTSQTTQEVKAGGNGTLHLQIIPANGFKVSPEAPLKINLSAEGLKLNQSALGHDDAKDKKSTSPEFGVKFGAPEQGGKSIQVDATFFVCDEKICERKTEKLSVAINVKP
jgi:hypothetical protein